MKNTIRQLEAERDALMANWKARPDPETAATEGQRHTRRWQERLRQWLKTGPWTPPAGHDVHPVWGNSVAPGSAQQG